MTNKHSDTFKQQNIILLALSKKKIEKSTNIARHYITSTTLCHKRKKDRYYNHLLVDVMYSQTHGEKTGSQGHFAFKGFSDLTVRSHTHHSTRVHACSCSLTDKVFGLRT